MHIHIYIDAVDIDEKDTIFFLKKSTILENCCNRTTEKSRYKWKGKREKFIQGLWKLCGQDRIGAGP